MFPDYHKYKQDPMLLYDLDRKQMEAEKLQRFMSLESLPLLREQELESTLLTSSIDNDDLSKVPLTQKPLSPQETRVLRKERRKQVQAQMSKEKEQSKLAYNFYT